MIGSRRDSYFAECIRPHAHLDPHLIKTPEGIYFTWEDDWECSCCEPEEPDRCYIWSKLELGERIIIPVTEEITLKKLIPEDSVNYFDLLDKNRDHLSQYGDITANKYPNEESVFQSIINPINPRKIRFGIWVNDTFVGMVGLTPLQHRSCETGGWTGKEFCRKGYGVITRTALAKYAIEKLGYKRVIAKTHPKNAPSQGMLIKAGYRRTYRAKEFYYFVFNK